ncbi:MAG: glycoside hydrolase family 43 protein [Oscillospiraceae bacterium]|nr:glycoside hydrolase family 43 protein [Oscillospiraceae bacterium]
MKYTNPIVKGFYPDPSVCFANGKFYLVCSSFQYFPGVPLFESDDLVNWKQIGHVLTRKTQVMLEKINSSGGVFAPTIRYHDGRFYMVTTNDTTHQNFYVYTDDIYGEWSEPIFVDQGGIDPSLLFDEGKVYFMSNGADDDGVGGVVQCEINVETGEKLSRSKCIWQGSGGRYLESPHLYKINGGYYLMAAEGGTEYGHMITYARSDNPWGPFVNYPNNPVLTNRNKAPFIIQGIGHGDLIQHTNGDWFILSLGFRQIHIWQPYHHLGREVFLTPVKFGEDGWFTAGTNGITDWEYEIKGDFEQVEKRNYTFENTKWNLDWVYLRHPVLENYELSEGKAVLHGTDITLDMTDTPTFLGIRQRDFNMDFAVDVTADKGEAGVTMYMSESEHYEVAIREKGDGFEAVLKLNIGDIKHVQSTLPLSGGKARLIVRADNFGYKFFVSENGKETGLGYGSTKYLSSEVSGGFTGVVMGLYAVGNNTAEFTKLNIDYFENKE